MSTRRQMKCKYDKSASKFLLQGFLRTSLAWLKDHQRRPSGKDSSVYESPNTMLNHLGLKPNYHKIRFRV